MLSLIAYVWQALGNAGKGENLCTQMQNGVEMLYEIGRMFAKDLELLSVQMMQYQLCFCKTDFP